MPDKDRGTFSGYDSLGKIHIRLGYHQMRALIELLEESIMLGGGMEE